MNVEGVDTYNACYGGTNAVFSTLGWLHSPSWDGRYAVVVTSDISVQNERFKFTCGGPRGRKLLVTPGGCVLTDWYAAGDPGSPRPLALPRGQHRTRDEHGGAERGRGVQRGVDALEEGRVRLCVEIPRLRCSPAPLRDSVELKHRRTG